MWSDDCAMSGLVLQCSSCADSAFDMNTKPIVLYELRASYVIVPGGSVNSSSAAVIMSNN